MIDSEYRQLIIGMLTEIVTGLVEQVRIAKKGDIPSLKKLLEIRQLLGSLHPLLHSKHEQDLDKILISLQAPIKSKNILKDK